MPVRGRSAFASLIILALAACHGGARHDGYRVYVTNETSGDLSVLDQDGRTVGNVRLGKRPRGVQVSPDGRTVYVAMTGSPAAPPGVDERTLPPPDRAVDGIGVVDASTLTLKRVIRGVADPEQLALSRDGVLYAGSEAAGAVIALDPDSGRMRTTIPLGDEPEGVAISPDGRFLYVTLEDDNQVAVIDTAVQRVLKRFAVAGRPRSVAFSPDGSHAYVTCELDGAVTLVDARTHTPLTTVKLGGEGARPMGVVVSADGRSIFVSTGRGGEVVQLDGTKGSMIARLAVGQRPWGIALSPDGRRLFAANGPSNDVGVIDAKGLRLIARVKAGFKPWGVAIGPVPSH